ncbi:glycosyltransferase family 4 protein [Candidatus Micrarchaeota archaeon]|nr:glycosyltransferase family 4 protein [Candidatus Micrarchaeota archaeon]
MRILMLNLFFPPYEGGTEKHVYEVSRRLAKKHDVTVLTARLPGTKKEETVDGIRVVRTPAWVLKDLPGPLPPPVPLMPEHAADVRRLLKQHDVLHAHNRFFYGLDLVNWTKKAKKPLYLTLHNARPDGIDFSTDFWGQAYDDTIGKTIMNACTGVLGVSRNTLDVTLPKKFKGKTAVAYNGVDGTVFRPQASGVKDRLGIERMVLCVARFVPQKGLEYLLDAMADVDADLVLVGRGPLEKKLKNQAKKLKIENRVHVLTQKITNKELATYYAAADVFCLPSLWEPFGMVAAEALACSVPVVATRIGGLPEVVRDPKDGFLVPPKSPHALSKRIQHLLDDPKKARKMGQSGRAHVLKKFTWEKTAEAYEKMYRNR